MGAILRRTASRPATSAPISAGALQLWPQRRRVAWKGTPIPLTSAEFELFEQLLRHAGDVVSKADLSQRALGRPLARFDRSVDVHISSIRQKLTPVCGAGCAIENDLASRCGERDAGGTRLALRGLARNLRSHARRLFEHLCGREQLELAARPTRSHTFPTLGLAAINDVTIRRVSGRTILLPLSSRRVRRFQPQAR